MVFIIFIFYIFLLWIYFYTHFYIFILLFFYLFIFYFLFYFFTNYLPRNVPGTAGGAEMRRGGGRGPRVGWLAKSTVGWVSRHRRRPPAARLYGPEIRSSPAGGDVRRGAGAPRGGHRSEVAAPAVNRPGDNRWHPLVFEFSPLDGPVLPCDSRR